MRGLSDAERIRTLMAPVGERRPRGPFHPVLLTAALAWAAAVLGAEQAAPAARLDAFVESRHHPAIAYGRGPLDNAVAALNERLAAGQAALPFDPQTGYLRATLEALEISADSQVLVYSPMSFQASRITQQNPRAIYFNDTIAVGWIRGAELLEITAQDPRHGTIFYSIGQTPTAEPRFNRQEQCVSCHLTWDTLGVPGPTVRTTRPRQTPGEFASGGPVDHRRPISERWGGWFVTGVGVPGDHMGNRPLLRPTPPGGPAPRLTSVDGQFDTTGYLRTTSDIVALMLLEHQTQAANLITRAGWEARLGDPARTKAAAEALADYLLFVGEARIDEPIEGTSAFARAFQSRGPRDAMGRSLRDLQLDGRLMRYPLSYMVGTPMFDALPEEAAAIVRARLAAVLTGRDTSLRYAHLSAADRQAIIEILDATKPLLQIGR